MLQIDNQTPFESSTMVTSDRHGADMIVLTVKGSFNLLPTVKLAEEQAPIKTADEYLEDPASSSLLYASEMMPLKPGSDVILNGHAYSPTNQAVDVIDTQVSIGNVRKVVRVFGDRLWVHGGMSAPQPFTQMPLIYENAYGGLHHYQPDQAIGPNSAIAVESNPIGKGFLGKRKPAEMIGQALPNLEDVRYLIRSPMDNPDPASFGYVPAFWLPRRQFAGTYDEQWQASRAPFLPLDFDERFYLCGSKDLSFARTSFQGGEPVRLLNVAPQATIEFPLPAIPIDCQFKFCGSWMSAPMVIETVLFEPDENRFSLIWKTQFSCNKKVLKVSDVKIDIKGAGQQMGVAAL